jgi:lipopolysaccharide export system permease protein
VMVSGRGFAEYAPNGDRFLTLLEGRRYEGAPGEADFSVMEFARYATRIQARESVQPKKTQKSLSTPALVANPTGTNLGELMWRIGIPVSALVLALLAIPMSFVNPRAGRSVSLLFGLLSYMVYYNLLSLSQARIAQGKFAFAVGSWLVHALMVAVLIALFARHMTLVRWPWRR